MKLVILPLNFYWRVNWKPLLIVYTDDKVKTKHYLPKQNAKWTIEGGKKTSTDWIYGKWNSHKKKQSYQTTMKKVNG